MLHTYLGMAYSQDPTAMSNWLLSRLFSVHFDVMCRLKPSEKRRLTLLSILTAIIFYLFLQNNFT